MSRHITVHHAGHTHRVLLAQAQVVSRHLCFDRPVSNALAVPAAKATSPRYHHRLAWMADGRVLNTGEPRLLPHCHGTHTEGIGHLLPGAASVLASAPAPLLPATLIRVQPTPLADTHEPYTASGLPTDRVITAHALRQALKPYPAAYREALVVACDTPLAYFTLAAMAWLVHEGVRHLLVELPSLDRFDDGGQLVNHRLFWGLNGYLPRRPPRDSCTVTELLAVHAATASGCYFLDLHLPDWGGDAVPSRAILYPFALE